MSDREFIPSDLVVLRTPLLPMEEIEAWSAGLLSPAQPGDPEAFQHDRALLRRRLQALLERPEVREALFLASPDLTDPSTSWCSTTSWPRCTARSWHAPGRGTPAGPPPASRRA